jgi:hypothetical protein
MFIIAIAHDLYRSVANLIVCDFTTSCFTTVVRVDSRVRILQLCRSSC